MSKKVIIIGSGIGGLATAARLLHDGFEVTILEKNSYIGGKTSQYQFKDFKFDLTASIVMFPKDYIELFNYCGENFKDYFKMKPINPIYKAFFYDNTSYSFYNDLPRLTSTLNKFKTPNLFSEYLNLMHNNYKKFEFVDKFFLNEPLTLKDFSSRKNIFENFSFDFNPFISCNQELKNTISSNKLREYLNFQSMYIGISPYKSSNFYNMIPTISQIQGLYHIEGGLYSYILALEKLIKKYGGNIKLNHCVNKILFENNKVIGVDVNNEKLFSDLVVCNADYYYALNHLVTSSSVKKYLPKHNNINHSCSIFILHLALNKKYDNLNIHNIYINHNLEKNVTALFNGYISSNPPLYIYCPSRIDETVCSKSCEVLSVYVRLPNLRCSRSNWGNTNTNKFADKIIDILSSLKGLEDLKEHIIHKHCITPINMLYDFNASLGSAFGLSHTLNQSLFFRPQSTIKNINNLFFTGASTHPGNGVAMVLKSAKICANSINNKI